MALELINFTIAGHASLDTNQQLNVIAGGIQFIRAPGYPFRTRPMHFISTVRVNELDDIGETPEIRIEIIGPDGEARVMFTAVGGGNWDLENSIVPDMPFVVHDIIPFTLDVHEAGLYTFRSIWDEQLMGSWSIHFE